jgi:hypothetical protein
MHKQIIADSPTPTQSNVGKNARPTVSTIEIYYFSTNNDRDVLLFNYIFSTIDCDSSINNVDKLSLPGSSTFLEIKNQTALCNSWILEEY